VRNKNKCEKFLIQDNSIKLGIDCKKQCKYYEKMWAGYEAELHPAVDMGLSPCFVVCYH